MSIVIPVFNEQENIGALYERLEEVLSRYEYEIVFVNDGSTDKSAEEINKLIDRNYRVKLINFSRNFGHEAATTAGVCYSTGDAVIVMDADLQDPPELIPGMIGLWKEGYEVVYAERDGRQGETVLKKATSRLFYKFMSKVSDVTIPENTGDFRLMDRRVVDDFKKLGEKNRFFRGLVSWVGYNQTGIKFKREKRYAGRTKYNYGRLLRLSLDSMTSFSTKPLSLITLLGIGISLISFIMGIVFIFIKVFAKFPVSGWTSIIVTLLFLSGFQIFLIGIVAEYVARMFTEMKGRPLYLVREIVDRQEKLRGKKNGKASLSRIK